MTSPSTGTAGGGGGWGHGERVATVSVDDRFYGLLSDTERYDGCVQRWQLALNGWVRTEKNDPPTPDIYFG